MSQEKRTYDELTWLYLGIVRDMAAPWLIPPLRPANVCHAIDLAYSAGVFCAVVELNAGLVHPFEVRERIEEKRFAFYKMMLSLVLPTDEYPADSVRISA